eukprot:1997020-Rhodomonas_salina.1
MRLAPYCHYSREIRPFRNGTPRYPQRPPQEVALLDIGKADPYEPADPDGSPGERCGGVGVFEGELEAVLG